MLFTVSNQPKRNRAMPQSRSSTIEMYTQNALWKTPARVFHWLTAVSLLGATSLTSQGDIGHAALEFIALGALLIQLLGISKAHTPGHALWLVTTVVIVLDLSGWIAPYSTFHLGTTLAALVLASLYCATVLFESLQRFTARTSR
jgi:cytochrome b